MKIGMMNNPAQELIKEITFAGENGFDFIDLTIEPPCAQVGDMDISKIVELLVKYELDVIGHTNFYLPRASPIKRLKHAVMEELS